MFKQIPISNFVCKFEVFKVVNVVLVFDFCFLFFFIRNT